MNRSRLFIWILLGAVVATFFYERALVQRRLKENEAAQWAQRIPSVTAAGSITNVIERAPKSAPAPVEKSATAPRLARKTPASASSGELGSMPDRLSKSAIPDWGKTAGPALDSVPRIAELFPEARDLPLPNLLSHLAVTDFQTSGPVVFEGADENYHEYDQNGLHGEQVQKYFSPAGGLAIEQINYSQDEQIVKRYNAGSASLAEVSYEYKNQGGVLRFQPDGSVESFHTWDQNNNQILTRYDAAGHATEVWRWSPDTDWQQVR